MVLDGVVQGRMASFAAPTGQPPSATAIVSMKTAPVNHSAGPAPVSRVFLVISMGRVWR